MNLKLLASCLIAVVAGSATASTIETQLVARVTPDEISQPQWAGFCPVVPDLILIQGDGRAVLKDIKKPQVRTIDRDGYAVGWIDHLVLWSNTSGKLTMLSNDTLTPSDAVVTLRDIAVPWYQSRGRRLALHVQGDASDFSDIPKLIPRAVVKRQFVARSTPERFRIDESDPRVVVRSNGSVVRRFESPVHRIQPSPDGYRLLVLRGVQFYVVSTITGLETSLARADTWSWFPDSDTLVGARNKTDASGHVSTETTLIIVSLTNGSVRDVELPQAYRGTVMHVHDISSDGHILLGMRRVVPEFKNLGLVVLKPVWE